MSKNKILKVDLLLTYFWLFSWKVSAEKRHLYAPKPFSFDSISVVFSCRTPFFIDATKVPTKLPFVLPGNWKLGTLWKSGFIYSYGFLSRLKTTLDKGVVTSWAKLWNLKISFFFFFSFFFLKGALLKSSDF